MGLLKGGRLLLLSFADLRPFVDDNFYCVVSDLWYIVMKDFFIYYLYD